MCAVIMLEHKILILIFLALRKPSCRCLSTVPKNQEVKIANGILQGTKVVAADKNLIYYAFLGVPYAKPPIGNLRFKPPQPAANWTGILDAREERSKCMQFSEGSEDCLFLNIYTPYTENLKWNQTALPVIVFIHGGGFIINSCYYMSWGPELLLQHDVIVVVFNYRLGVFGFFNTGDMNSPGNYGLKDQVAVLKWVQKNIQHFGGDPSRVTIYGQSAGAASVHYLLQTPITKGLFHKAISGSGCSLSTWALNRKPKQTAFQVGLLAGIVTNNTKHLVNQLRKIDCEELDAITQKIFLANVSYFYDGLMFSPSIEPQHDGALLVKGSYDVLASQQLQQIPYLIGFTSLESKIIKVMLNHLNNGFSAMQAEKDALPSGLVHDAMNIDSLALRTKVGLDVKYFYFGNSSFVAAPDDDVAAYFSDDMFVRPIRETIKLHYRSAPVYLYRFSYEGSKRRSGENKKKKGVSHAEELRYYFGLLSDLNANRDIAVSKKVTKLWTNFAKTGNPTPTSDKLLDNVSWPLALSVEQNSDLSFLDINDVLTVKVNPREEAMKFWDDLYNKYGHPNETY